MIQQDEQTSRGARARLGTDALGLDDRDIVILWAWATGRDPAWLCALYGWNLETVRSAIRKLLRKLDATGKTHATAIVLRTILERPAVAPARSPRRARVDTSFETLVDGAHEAIRNGADPALILSYVIWPPESLTLRAAA